MDKDYSRPWLFGEGGSDVGKSDARSIGLPKEQLQPPFITQTRMLPLEYM